MGRVGQGWWDFTNGSPFRPGAGGKLCIEKKTKGGTEGG